MKDDINALYQEASKYLDILLGGLECFNGARDMLLDPLLPLSFVLASDYKNYFPQHASLTCNDQSEFIKDDYAPNDANKELLSPTCCYPLFYKIQHEAYSVNQLFTVKGTCFRKEAHYERWRRQRVFHMREYIYIGDSSSTENWVESVKETVENVMKALGLPVHVEYAQDPFFNPVSLKVKLQQHHKLKREFVVNELAVGSINYHLNSFGKKCEIQVNNKNAFSACFGLGYQRMWYSLMEIHGNRALDVLIEATKQKSVPLKR